PFSRCLPWADRRGYAPRQRSRLVERHLSAARARAVAWVDADRPRLPLLPLHRRHHHPPLARRPPRARGQRPRPPPAHRHARAADRPLRPPAECLSVLLVGEDAGARGSDAVATGGLARAAPPFLRRPPAD